VFRVEICAEGAESAELAEAVELGFGPRGAGFLDAGMEGEAVAAFR